MMIPSDRGRVMLDLEDGQPPLKLWYPHLAMEAIDSALGVSTPYADSGRFVEELLTPRALPIFIWAGRLWEDENLQLDVIKKRMRKNERPQLLVVKEVRRALVLSLSGKDPDAEAPTEEEDEPADPPPPTMNGAGVTPSGSPSVSSG